MKLAVFFWPSAHHGGKTSPLYVVKFDNVRQGLNPRSQRQSHWMKPGCTSVMAFTISSTRPPY
ncbi:MAG: hypothetical protein NTZ98_23880, partial [Acidobacteria bacterium]|nr:hypothetical protein [Acidobacteriota bacterium]